MGPTIKNLVLFKIGWLACVFFAAAGNPWVGITAVILVSAAHLLSTPAWRKEALLLLAAGILGFAWESVLVGFGVLAYPTAPGSELFAPLWIVAMWVLFATTLNVGLKWVKHAWWTAVLAGAIGGPMAFLAGSSMGAVQFGLTPWSLVLIGAGWALLMPALVMVAEAIDRNAYLEPTQPGQRTTPLLEQIQILLHLKGGDKA